MATPLPKNYQYLDCRDLGHAWFVTASKHRVQVNGRIVAWMRVLRCRCTTVRTDLIDAHGQIESRRYKYPKGYHLPGERLEAQREARLIMLRLSDKAPRWLNIREKRSG